MKNFNLADLTNPAVPPKYGTTGTQPAENVSYLLSALINLILIVGSITFVFMLLYGGYQWITSGGDKEGLTKARGRITQALIGIVILFSVYAFLSFLSEFFGIDLIHLNLP